MPSRRDRLLALRRALNNLPDDGMTTFELKALSAIWRWAVREIDKEKPNG